MKNSIKKIIWTRVVIASISILVFAGVVLTCALVIKMRTQEIQESNVLVSNAYNAETAHYNWGSNLKDHIYTGSEFTGTTDCTACDLGKWIYGDRGTHNEDILKLIDEIEPIHKEIHESATTVINLKKTNQAQAEKYYEEHTKINIDTLVSKLETIIDTCQQINDKDTHELITNVTMLIILSVVCCLFVVFCLITLVKYVMLKVVKPVLEITEKSTALSRGSLAFHMDIEEDNELKKLSESLETSVITIKEYVSDIDETMAHLSNGDFTAKPSINYIGDFTTIQKSIENFIENISGALSVIGEISHQMTDGSSSLSNSAQSLAQGATEQASSVENLSFTTGKISKSSTENSEAARQSMDKLNEANDEVKVCNENMKQMVQAMAHIDKTSQEISKILKSIEDIAFQTNILSLNASVEAARAGTAGKGFAVVADEVRNLAAKSDEAAKSTKQLIDSALKAVEYGNEIVSSISSALEKTADLSSAAVSSMSEIASAVENESKSLEEVTQGIEQISIVVQNNTATSQEQAAASEALFNNAETLREEISKFRLK